MAKYTAADIKTLREKTGAGMLDVKKALDEADGDVTKAEEIVRVKGLKGIAKREGRAASAGLIALAVSEDGTTGTMVEVNSETDFVAKNDKFIAMADKVLAAAAEAKTNDIEQLRSTSCGEGTVQDEVEGLASVIGEKIEVSHVATVSGDYVEAYGHRTSKDLPPQVGVLVGTDEAAKEVAHDIALHIAFAAPTYLSREDVPAEIVAREEAIAEETTRAEGKPEKAIPMIVKGRMNGFYKEACLLDQPFSKDNKVTIGELVEKTGGKITGFARLRVGE